MRRFFIAAVLALVLPAVATDLTATKQLALELAQDGSHEASAIEYRRLALSEEEPSVSAAYYWAAASQYFEIEDYDRTSKMLDRTEDLSSDLTTEALLLRSELAYSSTRFEEASLYLGSLLRKDTDPKTRTFLERRAAGALVAQGGPSQALSLLEDSSLSHTNALPAVMEYSRGKDKRPWIGGVLGIIPGLGYTYTGEWGNALRAVIINGLFIYGMTETAANGDWGFFSVIAFFETTWYTGSIYGSIDAVHRYNRDRLETCLDAIDADTSFTPNLTRLPVISLHFSF